MMGSVRQAQKLSRAAGALVAAGQQDYRQAQRLQRPCDGLEVLAGQDFGRGHQGRLEAGAGGVGHGQHGHHGLARADVALQQPAHPFAGGQIAANLRQRADLGAGQLEGKSLLGRIGQRTGWNARAGRRAARGLALGQGQLVGQQFVIGQAATRPGERRKIGLAGRGMHRCQGLAPAWKLFTRLPSGVLPFGELGRARQSLQGELAKGSRGQAVGGGVDRLDLGDVAGALLVDDVVRMGDLEFGSVAVRPLDLAADGAARALGVLALQVRAVALEPDQGQEAGAVPRTDLPRLAEALRREVGVDGDDEGLDLALYGLVDRGHGSANQARWRGEQHVAHDRAG